MSKTYDEKGNELKFYALYYRYHSPYEEECESLAEAKDFLFNGEKYGELSSKGIKLPDGTEIEYGYLQDARERRDDV